MCKVSASDCAAIQVRGLGWKCTPRLIFFLEGEGRVRRKSPSGLPRSDEVEEAADSRGIERGFYYYASSSAGYRKSDNSYAGRSVGSRRDFYRLGSREEGFESASVRLEGNFSEFASGLDYCRYAYRKECLKYVESRRICRLNEARSRESDFDECASNSSSHCSSSREESEESSEEKVRRGLDEAFERARTNRRLENSTATTTTTRSELLLGRNCVCRQLQQRRRRRVKKVGQIENLEYSRDSRGCHVLYAATRIETTLRASECRRSVEIRSINGSEDGGGGAAGKKPANGLFRQSADGATMKCRLDAFLRNAGESDENGPALSYRCESERKVINVVVTEVTWRWQISCENGA